MGNNLRRHKRPSRRRRHKRSDTCVMCAPIVSVIRLLDSEQRVKVPCPFCGRSLRLPATAKTIEHETLRKALQYYGRLVVRKSGLLDQTVCTFSVDGEVIYAEPTCGCNDDERICSKHDRIVLRFETELPPGKEMMLISGPDGIQKELRVGR